MNQEQDTDIVEDEDEALVEEQPSMEETGDAADGNGDENVPEEE